MPDNTAKISVSKQVISTLPICSFDGDIFLVDSIEKADQAIEYLKTCSLIGFDTETKPSFTKGRPNKVALMQLASEDRCYLLRLNKIGICDSLRSLLEDANIKKIGLSIHDDFNVMHRSSDVAPAGFIELQRMVKDYDIADISLQKIFAILFGKKISKSQRLSNWEAANLTRAQQVYAATDAWACLKIYSYLLSGNFDPNNLPVPTIDQSDAK